MSGKGREFRKSQFNDKISFIKGDFLKRPFDRCGSLKK
jgi:hypothetical protein